MTINWVVDALGLVTVITFCAIATTTDLRSRRISNGLTYSTICIGILLGLIREFSGYGPERGILANGLLDAILGGGLCFLITLLIWIHGGLGGGDVKLVSALGLLLGARISIHSLLYAHLLAGLFVTIWLISRLVVPGSRCADTGHASSNNFRFDQNEFGKIQIPMAGFYACGVWIAMLVR